jgi:hypothetical protein
VHSKWELVRRVDEDVLTPREREQAGRFPAGWLP